MKLNNLIFLLLIFCNTFIKAQNNTSKDSIIFLKEINVTSEQKKKKQITKVHLDGRPSYSGLRQIEKIVSAVTNIPNGHLSYVDFYFNTGIVNLFKKKLEIEYKDTELGLLLYEFDENGLPGKPISENEITFTVKENDSGKFRIDLSTLNLENYKNLYIGFLVLTKSDSKQNTIYVRFSEKENASTYIVNKIYQSQDWKKYYSATPTHIKLTLGIETN